MEQQLLMVPVDQLEPAKDNPRRQVGEVAELAASIRAVGILEPLIAHQEVLKVACKLLELTPDGTAYGDALRTFATSDRARQRAEAAIAFATHEEFLSPWWASWDGHEDYFDLLERHGYELAERETAMLPKRKALAKKTKAA